MWRSKLRRHTNISRSACFTVGLWALWRLSLALYKMRQRPDSYDVLTNGNSYFECLSRGFENRPGADQTPFGDALRHRPRTDGQTDGPTLAL